MGIYRRPDSPTYWMSRQVQGRRVRLNTGTTDPRLAEEIYAAWTAELARERWLGSRPLGQHYTVGELIDAYCRLVTTRKSVDSQRRDQAVLKRFDDVWGALRLCELRPLMLEEYVTARLRQISFATVSKELGILKAAFHAARRWGWLATSPFTGIRLNQEGTSRIRWLTEDEEQRVLAACPAWLRNLIIVGLDTGLRPGNLVGLQRTWLHESGTLLIVPQEATKTRRSPIAIPLTSRARGILSRLLGSPSASSLFVHSNGHRLTRDGVNAFLRRKARSVGLRDVCLYTLRHTFITRLVHAGRPLPEVAALAGHRSIVTTMRYVHLVPSHLRAAIRALEQARTPDPIPNPDRCVLQPTPSPEEELR